MKLEYQHYVYPQYQQHLSRSFVPDLSIIDMLANVGPDCMRLINETNSNLMELKH
ncbi:MAG: WbqC family protein [Thaumarchaeota archaeon]|nr:MAG: WbqC family protein [Nitrososphaerota archaeon]